MSELALISPCGKKIFKEIFNEIFALKLSKLSHDVIEGTPSELTATFLPITRNYSQINSLVSPFVIQKNRTHL